MSSHAFYSELARWWPLVSPVEEYAEEAAEAASLLRRASRPVKTVLELGSGGGHNAAHLKRHFALTLTDLSEPMLAVSRALNPECEHVCADMRTLRLGRTFDAVFVHDAVDYMISEADLSAAIQTAFIHLSPGGVAVFMPDLTAESFEPSTDWGGTDGPDGSGVRFLEWTYDPDASDARISTEYAFLLKEPDGKIQTVRETHVTGLFPRETWLRLLRDAGFQADAELERTAEAREPRTVFVAHRLSTR
jgi:SAM-dependent methyltransferase